MALNDLNFQRKRLRGTGGTLGIRLACCSAYRDAVGNKYEEIIIINNY